MVKALRFYLLPMSKKLKSGKVRYVLTYDVVDPNSAAAEAGEFSMRGHVTRRVADHLGAPCKQPAEFGFREALEILVELGVDLCPVFADSWPVSEAQPPRWLTFRSPWGWGEGTRWSDDAELNVHMHLPEELDGKRRMALYSAFNKGFFTGA